MTRESIEDPATHLALRMILSNDPAPAPLAVWSWARGDIRFSNEYPQVVASFPRLLDAPVGDCNDLAVATAALLMAARVPVMWALGFDGDGKPRHIWTIARVGDGWVHVDPSPGADAPGGRAPANVSNATISGWEAIEI